MIFNRRGQFGWIVYLVVAVFFFFFWALFFGGFIADQGAIGVAENNITGIEAFFLSNFNLVILFSLFLSIFAVVYFGGGSR